MPEGFWWNVLKSTNPEIYSAANDMRERAIDKNMANLFEQGYEGADVSGGIREERSGLGSLLQSVGILDEPQPRELAPHERGAYRLGKRSKVIEGQEDTKFNETKQTSDINQYGATAELMGAGAGMPSTMMQDLSPDEIRALSNYGIQGTKHRKITDAFTEAQTKVMRGKGDKAAAPTTPFGHKYKEPITLAADISKTMTPLIKEYNDILKDIPPLGSKDRWKQLLKAYELQRQIGMRAQIEGLSYYQGDKNYASQVAANVLGRPPLDIWKEAGLPSDVVDLIHSNPALGDRYMEKINEVGFSGFLNRLKSGGGVGEPVNPYADFPGTPSAPPEESYNK